MQGRTHNKLVLALILLISMSFSVVYADNHGSSKASQDSISTEQVHSFTKDDSKIQQKKSPVKTEKPQSGGGVVGNVLLFFILMLAAMVFIKLISNKRKGL